MNTEELLGREYQPRVIDRRLSYLLGISGAVVVEGPRACGKTMSGLHVAASAEFLDSTEAQEMMTIAPHLLLEGATPRLIDEWQVHPEIWNMIRRAVDKRGIDGQFILTGSAVPDDDATRHTGAGRFLRLRQRTMSWYERGLSAASVSLSQLFEGIAVESKLHKPDIESVLTNVCVSGFPAHTHRTAADTAVHMLSYAEEISRTDLKQLSEVRHEPATITQLMRSLARNTASEVSIKTLLGDVEQVAPTMRRETISKYVGLLQRLFVVESIGPWAGKLRSKANLRKSSKFMLADPALAVALLGATPEGLLSDLETAGFLFENAVLHDLAIYVESLGGRLKHFRDSYGNEIDAILELPDGRWGAVEVKLGGGAALGAAQNLIRVVDLVDFCAPPSFLAVITGTGMTLTYPNGVVTFPLSELCP